MRSPKNEEKLDKESGKSGTWLRDRNKTCLHKAESQKRKRRLQRVCIVPGCHQGEKFEFYSECKWETWGGLKHRDHPSCSSGGELQAEGAVGRPCQQEIVGAASGGRQGGGESRVRVRCISVVISAVRIRVHQVTTFPSSLSSVSIF